jgi:hypothetical protein
MFIVIKCIEFEYNQGETYGSSNLYSITPIRLVKSKWKRSKLYGDIQSYKLSLCQLNLKLQLVLNCHSKDLFRAI